MTTIKEYKAMMEGATDAPWEARRNPCFCGSCEAGDIWRTDENYGDCTVCKDVNNYHDHLFIAASRNIAPDLIRVIELAEDRLSYAEKIIKELKTDGYGRFRPTKAQGEAIWFSVSQIISEIRKLKGE